MSIEDQDAPPDPCEHCDCWHDTVPDLRTKLDVAETELAALGTETTYCTLCTAKYRYIPGTHSIEYCFTCIEKAVTDEVECGYDDIKNDLSLAEEKTDEQKELISDLTEERDEAQERVKKLEAQIAIRQNVKKDAEIAQLRTTAIMALERARDALCNGCRYRHPFTDKYGGEKHDSGQWNGSSLCNAKATRAELVRIRAEL